MILLLSFHRYEILNPNSNYWFLIQISYCKLIFISNFKLEKNFQFFDL